MNAEAIVRCARIRGLTVAEIQHALDILAGCPTGATADALIELAQCTTRAVAALIAVAQVVPEADLEFTIEHLRHGQSRLRLKAIPVKH